MNYSLPDKGHAGPFRAALVVFPKTTVLPVDPAPAPIPAREELPTSPTKSESKPASKIPAGLFQIKSIASKLAQHAEEQKAKESQKSGELSDLKSKFEPKPEYKYRVGAPSGSKATASEVSGKTSVLEGKAASDKEKKSAGTDSKNSSEEPKVIVPLETKAEVAIGETINASKFPVLDVKEVKTVTSESKPGLDATPAKLESIKSESKAVPDITPAKLEAKPSEMTTVTSELKPSLDAISEKLKSIKTESKAVPDTAPAKLEMKHSDSWIKVKSKIFSESSSEGKEIQQTNVATICPSQESVKSDVSEISKMKALFDQAYDKIPEKLVEKKEIPTETVAQEKESDKKASISSKEESAVDFIEKRVVAIKGFKWFDIPGIPIPDTIVVKCALLVVKSGQKVINVDEQKPRDIILPCKVQEDLSRKQELASKEPAPVEKINLTKLVPTSGTEEKESAIRPVRVSKLESVSKTSSETDITPITKTEISKIEPIQKSEIASIVLKAEIVSKYDKVPSPEVPKVVETVNSGEFAPDKMKPDSPHTTNLAFRAALVVDVTLLQLSKTGSTTLSLDQSVASSSEKPMEESTKSIDATTFSESITPGKTHSEQSDSSTSLAKAKVMQPEILPDVKVVKDEWEPKESKSSVGAFQIILGEKLASHEVKVVQPSFETKHIVEEEVIPAETKLVKNTSLTITIAPLSPRKLQTSLDKSPSDEKLQKALGVDDEASDVDMTFPEESGGEDEEKHPFTASMPLPRKGLRERHSMAELHEDRPVDPVESTLMTPEEEAELFSSSARRYELRFSSPELPRSASAAASPSAPRKARKSIDLIREREEEEKKRLAEIQAAMDKLRSSKIKKCEEQSEVEDAERKKLEDEAEQQRLVQKAQFLKDEEMKRIKAHEEKLKEVRLQEEAAEKAREEAKRMLIAKARSGKRMSFYEKKLAQKALGAKVEDDEDEEDDKEYEEIEGSVGAPSPLSSDGGAIPASPLSKRRKHESTRTKRPVVRKLAESPRLSDDIKKVMGHLEEETAKKAEFIKTMSSLDPTLEHLRSRSEDTVTFDFSNSPFFSQFTVRDPERDRLLRELASAISNHPYLKTVSCESSGLDDYFAEELALCFTETGMPKLETLILECNFFTGKGLAAICQALADPLKFPELRTLKLANQLGVSTEAEQAALEALRSNPKIKLLTLDFKRQIDSVEATRLMARNAALASRSGRKSLMLPLPKK